MAAHQEELEKRIELEKLVEAYKKDLEEQLRLREEARISENEALAAEMQSQYDDVSDRLSVVRDSLAFISKNNDMREVGFLEHMNTYKDSEPGYGGVSPRFDVMR